VSINDLLGKENFSFAIDLAHLQLRLANASYSSRPDTKQSMTS